MSEGDKGDNYDDRDFLLNPANWPDASDNLQLWLKFSLSMLRSEIGCALEHVAKLKGDEPESQAFMLALHLENLRDGVQSTREALIESMPPSMVAELVRYHMEMKDGRPYRVVEIPGMGFGLTPDDVSVPDNLDGLDEPNE